MIFQPYLKYPQIPNPNIFKIHSTPNILVVHKSKIFKILTLLDSGLFSGLS